MFFTWLLRDLVRLYRFILGIIFRLILGKDWRARYTRFKGLTILRDRSKEILLGIRRRGDHLCIFKTPTRCVVVMPVDSVRDAECIYWYNVYLKHHEIKSTDIIIDAGAHVGLFTLKVAKKAKDGLVLAVEPHPYNFALLKENILLNRLRNVILIRVALSNFNGESKLYIGKTSSLHTIVPKRSHTFISNKGEWIKVRTRTLDSILEELGIKEVNFMKIDVEGLELEVLRGAEKTLTHSKRIAVSVASYHYPTEAKEIINFLRSKGFQIRVLQSRGETYVYGWKQRSTC